MTLGHCGEAVLVSSAVKLLKRLEKVLSAIWSEVDHLLFSPGPI